MKNSLEHAVFACFLVYFSLDILKKCTHRILLLLSDKILKAKVFSNFHAYNTKSEFMNTTSGECKQLRRIS